MFTPPSQIAFTIYGLNIYYYGIIMALAICAGVLISDWAGTKYFGLKKDTIIDLAPYLIIFGILGARLYYCVLNYDFYLRFPTEIIAIRHGGISIHGALLGGVCGLCLFAKKYHLNWIKLCDTVAVGLPIAQAIGRWGNFFNSEAFGMPTNLPWKLYIAPQYRPVPYQDFQFFHPAFLYESLLDAGIFVILLSLAAKGKCKGNGNVALVYLILYSLVRIMVETFRIDSVRYIFGIPVAILISAGIIIVSASVLFNKKRKGHI